MTPAMLKRFFSALAGRAIWLRIKRKFRVGAESILVIMPEDDDGLNAIALDNLEILLASRKLRMAAIVSRSDKVKRAVEELDCAAMAGGGRDVDYLLSYYELCRFTDSIVIASMSEPNGNKLGVALDKADFTEEELIRICCYGIRAPG